MVLVGYLHITSNKSGNQPRDYICKQGRENMSTLEKDLVDMCLKRSNYVYHHAETNSDQGRGDQSAAAQIQGF